MSLSLRLSLSLTRTTDVRPLEVGRQPRVAAALEAGGTSAKRTPRHPTVLCHCEFARVPSRQCAMVYIHAGVYVAVNLRNQSFRVMTDMFRHHAK